MHITILNNMISCVSVISILGFNKYWQTVLNLMEINMNPIFKQFLKDKTVNPKKKKIILSMIIC